MHGQWMQVSDSMRTICVPVRQEIVWTSKSLNSPCEPLKYETVQYRLAKFRDGIFEGEVMRFDGDPDDEALQSVIPELRKRLPPPKMIVAPHSLRREAIEFAKEHRMDSRTVVHEWERLQGIDRAELIIFPGLDKETLDYIEFCVKTERMEISPLSPALEVGPVDWRANELLPEDLV